MQPVHLKQLQHMNKCSLHTGITHITTDYLTKLSLLSEFFFHAQFVQLVVRQVTKYKTLHPSTSAVDTLPLYILPTQ